MTGTKRWRTRLPRHPVRAHQVGRSRASRSHSTPGLCEPSQSPLSKEPKNVLGTIQPSLPMGPGARHSETGHEDQPDEESMPLQVWQIQQLQPDRQVVWSGVRFNIFIVGGVGVPLVRLGRVGGGRILCLSWVESHRIQLIGGM